MFICGYVRPSRRTSPGADSFIAIRQLYGQGKYEQALPLAQQSLRVAEQSYGAESRQAAISLNEVAMGSELNALDRSAEAEPFYRRALAMNQKLLGPDDPEVATGYSNLGVFYQRAGRLAEAKDVMTRSLKIRRKPQPERSCDRQQPAQPGLGCELSGQLPGGGGFGAASAGDRARKRKDLSPQLWRSISTFSPKPASDRANTL